MSDNNPKVNGKQQQRVPVTLYGSECSLLLNVKHKMEVEAQKPLSISDIMREALRELAKVKGIATISS
jgi:hypothetical protein